jgi:hypothetical protein
MNINFTDTLVNDMLNEILGLSNSFWHYNQFRNCNMLSVFNPGGRIGKIDLSIKENFEFSTASKHCPILTKFISEEILPWLNPLGRVTILKTSNNQEMPIHLDCSLTETGTIQHKWRFVLNGDIEKLYFVNKLNEKVFVKNQNRCYVIDGGHPHSIEKSSNDKITICVGSPWKGQLLNSEYVSKLNLEHAMYIEKPTIKKEWVDPNLLK